MNDPTNYIDYEKMEGMLKAYPSFSTDQIMEQLDQLGIMEYVLRDDEETRYLQLRKEWSWLEADEFFAWYEIGCRGQLAVCNLRDYQHEII
jgi:hypothetical protein